VSDERGLQAGQQLGDGYRIERELGRGGMAVVYAAHDLKHNRLVAIKVLNPDLASAVGPERFLREIKTTAALRHPHILPLYDSGEAEGFLFYVMPLVEGESLQDRLLRERQLPLSDALQIAREVADALSYAHARNVIHRDIKPANILLESGHAVVADFGVAKAVSAAGGDRLTQTGLAIGTPSYMSPEQASGGEDVDGRSDLYSLACVLYEMLAGQPPFTGPTVESVVMQHLTADVRPVTQLRPGIPGEVAGLLDRALSKTPADRFSPAAQFVEALSRSTGPATSASPVAASPSHSVAVLPFQSLSTEPDSEFFADGITEEIINSLAQIPGLHVAARTSCFAFKGQRQDITLMGAQLRVAKVLEGSVRSAGNRLRITAQLINVADGYHIWSERYDRQLDDVFAIQDEIAAAIAEKLRGTLLGAPEAPATKARPVDVQAYQAYLRGRHLCNQRTRDALTQAVRYFQNAIDRDPDYAAAYAGLAEAKLLLGSYGAMAPGVAHEQALTAVSRALELDDSQAEAYAIRGQLLRHARDWAGEEEAYRRAIALNPNYATARQWYATLLAAQGRAIEADEQIRRAVELDPLSHAVGVTAAVVSFVSRRNEEALERLGRVHELAPDFASVHAWLAIVHADRGEYDRAIVSARRAIELSPGNPNVATGLAYAMARRGDREQALEIVEASVGRGAYSWPAMVHAALGDPDRAFALLDRAVDAEESWDGLYFAKVFPWFDPLRGDPRFAEVLRRLRVPA